MAENLAPGVDWTQPEPEELDPRNAAAVALYAAQNPKNFWAVQTHASNLLGQERWTEAIEWADNLIALFPENTHGGNGYQMKASAYRALEQPEKEAAKFSVSSRRNPRKPTVLTPVCSTSICRRKTGKR